MSNTIHELTQALRDAAAKIEAAAKFRFTEEIDLAGAIALLMIIKPTNTSMTLNIEIELPYGKRDKAEDVEVKYSIKESYRIASEGGSLKGVIESYAASKESKDSLASVARLIKEASKESSQDSPTVLDSPATTL